MVVFGSGGHTTEMLHMLSTSLKIEKYGTVCFVVGHSDKWSMTKLESFLGAEKLSQVELIKLFRAREVKQSYLTSVYTTLIGLLHSVKIIFKYRPDLIVSNGPGTAVPLCYASFFL